MAENLKTILNLVKITVDKNLESIMDSKTYAPNILTKSMKYSLLSGGKRIRPFLFIQTLKSLSVDYKDYINFACAIEMIHCYSLIHDDLPAMDNDDLRRGKPTNHVKFGETVAILAGDGLLNLAYETFAAFLMENNNANKIKAVYEIAKSAGIEGMVGGQTLDCIKEGKNVTKDELLYIHKNKTAAIITSSLVSAGYLGNLDEENISLLREFGYNLGMLFQIKDDILDVTGDPEKLGKSVGKDMAEDKNTYPKYYGIEESVKACENYGAKAKALLLEIPFSEKNIYVEFIDFLIVRDY